LKEYLQRKAREVINMLLAEYDYATDIAVQRAEERKIAYTEGKSLGIAEGARQKARETAQNLLSMGLSIDTIAHATGLPIQEIEKFYS